ncbi:L,D-transpeptidase [Rhodobacter ferrooxidans]|uniref:ErfK/YbiS/YcfS/YnhG family protein n=1 Tax=Rhodobacter ferrooxidans TaxID=371731 RepID=C8S2Y0_9RHOB|nr:L,D-transpeptidase [Rhodobacter sp. SW2]EEW24620.1 ErfK/YbiS/YcfS/YnhG family protein [Rhodobacter sp. SW2]
MLSRLISLAFVLVLSACAAEPPKPVVVPGYEAVQDGEFFIQAVDPQYLQGSVPRAEVDYAASDRPGTIVVDTHARRLYYVLEGGRAMRYTIAVGRAGLAFRGGGYIGRKEEWPSWTPTANMLRTQGDMYRDYAGGLPGGLSNPLGARAMYLYRNGHDTYFRIHGTSDVTSIGRATSAGCIRLFNQDAIDLYNRVGHGAHVKVRSLEESLAIEGPMMDDDGGHAVPYVPGATAAVPTDTAEANG